MSIDIVILIFGVFAIFESLRFVFLRATGCYCDLQLEDIVEENDETIAVYNGKHNGDTIQVTRVCLSSGIPQEIRVTADRFGNTYTDKQYVMLYMRLALLITATVIAVLLRVYLVS